MKKDCAIDVCAGGGDEGSAVVLWLCVNVCIFICTHPHCEIKQMMLSREEYSTARVQRHVCQVGMRNFKTLEIPEGT